MIPTYKEHCMKERFAENFKKKPKNENIYQTVNLTETEMQETG